MNRVVTIMLLVTIPRVSLCAELTLDQELIVACGKVDVSRVVRCLRNGANVNSTLGSASSEANLNPWTGGISIAAPAWTPLLALANSSRFPDPSGDISNAQLKEIQSDAAKAAALQKQITPAQIEKRQNEMLTILWILLSHGCDVNAHDGYGATAIYCAAEGDKIAMAKALLSTGANPNTKTDAYIDGPDGITPLRVSMHSKEMLQLLLDNGADASVKDSEGRTAADWIELSVERDFDFVSTSAGWRIQPRNRGK